MVDDEAKKDARKTTQHYLISTLFSENASDKKRRSIRLNEISKIASCVEWHNRNVKKRKKVERKSSDTIKRRWQRTTWAHLCWSAQFGCFSLKNHIWPLFFFCSLFSLCFYFFSSPPAKWRNYDSKCADRKMLVRKGRKGVEKKWVREWVLGVLTLFGLSVVKITRVFSLALAASTKCRIKTTPLPLLTHNSPHSFFFFLHQLLRHVHYTFFLTFLNFLNFSFLDSRDFWGFSG